jgi:transcriptional regulator with XRE-family HTH domain
MNKRLKHLRKTLDMTQADFADKLNMAQTSYSKIEIGQNNLTQKNIDLICLKFGVNEKWLKYGEEEMFNPVEDDPFVKEIIDLLNKMGEPEREVVLNYVKWYVSQQQTLQAAEKGKTPGIGPHPEPTPEPEGENPEPEPELPLEPIRPQAGADFEEDKAKGKGEKGESPGIGPRKKDGQPA